ncbi:11093_t:CDS:2 [Dentiscutata erythropus]|uniref:11093_t:CDS:1 n=1 Tax=Dentiscutata erythropus TaxID=1348616 RepID=A0A9N9I8S9_9GLOM|nr:11093_t:CDS:2 [Dentiscutata erythropus]
MALEVSSEYGYMIITGVASIFLTTYLGFQVRGYHKKAGVTYPYTLHVMNSLFFNKVYATKEEAEKDRSKFIFNCYQRAHQNTLENLPQFLFTLEAGGLKHPIIASVGGGIWILAININRSIGLRKTGGPEKIRRGAFSYLGLFALWGATISTSISLLKQ